jgi:hypothetical protein
VEENEWNGRVDVQCKVIDFKAGSYQQPALLS